jgi:hypothetical protein
MAKIVFATRLHLSACLPGKNQPGTAIMPSEDPECDESKMASHVSGMPSEMHSTPILTISRLPRG